MPEYRFAASGTFSTPLDQRLAEAHLRGIMADAGVLIEEFVITPTSLDLRKIGFDQNIIGALSRARGGITTVEALTLQTERQILKISGIGLPRLRQIIYTLSTVGLQLSGSSPYSELVDSLEYRSTSGPSYYVPMTYSMYRKLWKAKIRRIDHLTDLHFFELVERIGWDRDTIDLIASLHRKSLWLKPVDAEQYMLEDLLVVMGDCARFDLYMAFTPEDEVTRSNYYLQAEAARTIPLKVAMEKLRGIFGIYGLVLRALGAEDPSDL